MLPLAELIFGKRDFALLRWSDQGLMVPKGNHTVCKQTVPAQFSFGKLSGSLANRGPRKPLKRLDLNFYIMIVPTLCVTLALALRSREQIVSVCELLPRKPPKCRTIYPARSVRLFLSRPSGLRSRSDRREQVSPDTGLQKRPCHEDRAFPIRREREKDGLRS